MAKKAPKGSAARAEAEFTAATGFELPTCFEETRRKPATIEERDTAELGRIREALADVDKRYFVVGDEVAALLKKSRDAGKTYSGHQVWTLELVSDTLGHWKKSFLSKLVTVAETFSQDDRAKALTEKLTWHDCYEVYRLRKRYELSEPISDTIARFAKGEKMSANAKEKPKKPLTAQLSVVTDRVHGDHLIVAVEPDATTGKLTGRIFTKQHQPGAMLPLMYAAGLAAIQESIDPDRLSRAIDIAKAKCLYLTQVNTGAIASEDKTTGFSEDDPDRTWIEAALSDTLLAKLERVRKYVLESKASEESVTAEA